MTTADLCVFLTSPKLNSPVFPNDSAIKMASSTTITDFWRSHPKYWISIGAMQAAADAEITAKFWNNNIAGEHWIGQVIYYDQFMRHFCRANKVLEPDVIAARSIATDIVKAHIEELSHVDDFELMVCLMPFKHVGDYDFIFTIIHLHWLPANGNLTDFPILLRFYNDSYKKCYSNIDRIYSEIIEINEHTVLHSEFNSDLICDYYPDTEITLHPPAWREDTVEYLKEHYVASDTERPLIVSLSGGVDSMVMCYLLRCAEIPVIAVHIVYGNRAVSEQECSFIKHYCKRIGVPLYIYYIEWLRRDTSDREFYERMTRTIRFMVYRCVGGERPHVLLGHIRDDVVENIWSNFAKGVHLDNLAKMEPIEFMEGVYVHRPWLTAQKSAIYAISMEAGIPYLKNTTPSWSNRGKFREVFHDATHAQYGDAVDEKVIASATALASQAALVDKLLYEPIYASWDAVARTINVGRAIEAGLDADGWSRILTHVCHTWLGITKPSIHACRYFAEHIGGIGSNRRLILKKDLIVIYSGTTLKFIVFS